jgi:hypothetical protein
MALRDSMRGPVGSVESVGALEALAEAEAAAEVVGEFMAAVSLVWRRLADFYGVGPDVAGLGADLGVGVGPGIGRRFSLYDDPRFGVG